MSVYTPTFRRPAALAHCVASIQAQTIACQHVIIPDEVGIGIDGVYADVVNHADKVAEKYWRPVLEAIGETLQDKPVKMREVAA